MALDGNFIHCLCNELRDRIAGARVDKIHNPSKEEFVLFLRTRNGVYKLLLCLWSGRARANLITDTIENPPQPGMFCMLLRKYLQGAVLTNIRQAELERILFFDFAGTTEIGEPIRLCLCAEFTGRHTNLLLLHEGGVIIDCLKRGDLTQRQQPALPGLRYALPPGNGFVPPAPPAEPRPFLLRDSNGVPQRYGLTPPGEEMDSYSRLLEVFYTERDRAERKKQQVGALMKLVENRIARLRRKLSAQRQELAQAQNREHLRIYAELILSNKSMLENEPSARGSASYLLENYYDEGHMLAIPVNPALGPGANAQRYFKEYRKAKTAAAMLGDFITQGEEALQYLESVSDFLQRADSQTEIEAIRRELELQGYCRPPKGKRRAPAQLPPIEYRSSAGLRILVGRNNLQNEQLSLKTAKPSDLWFHTHDFPGSHVILCTQGSAPDADSVAEAAMLAAWHSKARGFAQVDYTPVKFLKKPNGSPPGKVIYHRFQSIYAQPTPARIQALKDNMTKEG